MTKTLYTEVVKSPEVKQAACSNLNPLFANPKISGYAKTRNLILTFLILISCQSLSLAAARTASVSGNWNSTATWGGSSVPVAGDAVTINSGVTVTVTAAAACTSLTYLATATTASNVNISSGITLTVSGAVTIPRSNSAMNTLAVGAGILNAGSIAFTSGGGTSRHQITISTGTVNVSGNVSQAGSTGSATITFTGAGLLQLGGTFLSSTTGTLTTFAGSTVEYDRTGAQTIADFTYDNLTLSGNNTKTLSSATVANGALTINTGATLSTSNNNYKLSFGGNFVNNGTFTAGSSAIEITNTDAVQSIDGFTTTGLVSMTKTGGTATLQGDINGAGLTINGAGGTLNLGTSLTHTFTGVVTLTAGTLNGGSSTLNENATSATAWNGTGSVFSAGTGTVNFGGANQTLSATATTFNHLTFSGSGTKILASTTTINGAYTIGSGVSANLGTGLTHTAFSLSLGGNGQPTGSYGGTGSAATFINTTYFSASTGKLNVGTSSCSAGTWIGGVSTDWNTGANWCSGTVPTAATDVTIFPGGNQPIIGAAALCNNITINTGASLSFSGAFSLTISGTFTNSGTFTPGTLSTVAYNGSAQTVLPATYNNLSLQGSGSKTLTGVTVNGILSMEGTATASVAPTYGSAATLQYNTATARTTGVEWISPVAATGGIIIANTGFITMNSAEVLGRSVPLTINAGATLSTSNNNYQLTFGGNFVNNGTFTTGSSPIVIANTAAVQSIDGFTTTGLVSMTKASGTATLTGDVNGAGLTLNGNAGILNLGSGLTHTFSGIWIRTLGTLNGGASTLKLGSSVTNTGGTFTAGTGTVEYYAATQTVAPLTYNNLTLSGSGAKTFPAGTTTVNGILSMEGTATTIVTGTLTYGASATLQYKGSSLQTTGSEFPSTFSGTGGVIVNNASGVNLGGSVTITNGLTLTSGTFTVGGNSLNLNGPSIAGTPGNLATSNSSSLGFGGSSTGVNIPASVSSLSNLTLNNNATGGITLNNPLSIVGVLTLTSGYLNSTTTNFITVSNTAVVGVVAGGGYINGPLARALLANIASDGTSYAFPVGDGTNYRPFDLVDIRTGATAPVIMVTENSTGATTFDGSTISAVDPRNWYMQTVSGSLTSTYVRMTDSGIDVTKNAAQSATQSGPYSSIGGANIGASITSVQSVNSNNYFAIGTAKVKTYYSYQSGDWKVSTTWTMDPSGSFSINPGVPSASDNVVILNGRTVTTNENGKNAAKLEVRLGGTLDLATRNGHNFGTVTGQGVIKLSSSSFPAGNYSGFVANDGGTVEYYDLNNTGLSSTQLTYNNLIVSNYSASNNSVYLDNATNPINYTLNGNFNLKRLSTGLLTFRFGNPTASDNLINLTVNGNFTVDAGCSIAVSNFASGQTIPDPALGSTLPLAAYPVHTLNLYGNLTNNGTIRFTGLPSPAVTAYYTLNTTAYSGTNFGDVQVYFKGGTDNTITCNGITDFFRMVVEKGTDQTNVLEVVSSATANFGLYAPNYQGTKWFNGGPEGYGIGAYSKALFIHYGTLKLNNNITIPSLTEGGQDFNLIPTACLWLNGANVSTTVSGSNGTGYQAATLYGKLRLSSGTFSTGDAAGIVLGTLGTPELIIEGTGILDASQAWVASGGSNLMSYIQTGGTANFRMQGENHAAPMLGLNSANTVFTMSGGTLNFTNNQFVDGSFNYQIIDIQSQQGNYQVTGGTVNLNLPGSATTYTANSTVPFYNLNLTKNGGTGNTSVQWNTNSLNTSFLNLNVLNDLTQGANTVLNLNTNTINLFLGHNYTLPVGATYTPGSNATTFNGTGGQVFTNAGTITTGLNNFVLTNASNTNITNNLTVAGNLNIDNSCFLNDQGSSISVAGNITNNGTHTSQANGSIILNLNAAQTIGGSGNGIFGNFTINKTGGSSTLSSNQTITGNLRLVSGILNINTFNLKLSAGSNIYDLATGTAAPTTFGNTKMIITSGLQSDGGLTKTYSAVGSFLFPVGTGAVYHPGTIAFTQAPATWGDVTIKPVSTVHPFVITGNQAMTYYWKVTSSGFAGIPTGSVSHTYHYLVADVGTSINTYITGIYNPFAWTTGASAQVDKIANNILFPGISLLDGDYTAGIPAALGAIKVFYSRQNGLWDTRSTWSNVSNTGAAILAGDPLPTSDDAVVIGDGLTNNHIVTIAANNKIIGGLQINSGSTLDIQTTTGHNFGALPDLKISGSGRLRISSGTFPGGDFGNFLGPDGGTVEYYTQSAIGNAFTLPTTYIAGIVRNITSYANLVLSPATGRTITLPNTNLTVFKDFEINIYGTNVAGIAQLNNQGNTCTITINGDLNVKKGNLQFQNTIAQNVIVNGNVTVANGAVFDVAAALSATNTLSINGDLTNNGTFDMYSNANRLCNVTFTGAANNGIKGTTALRTDFNILTVNKGVNRNSVLDATVNAFSLNTALATALTLTNGTFRLSSPGLTITLTTSNAFTIPTSGCLSANLGTINIGSNNDAGDLLLQGRLEVMNSGIINIGTSGTNFNNDIEYAAAGNPEINVSGGSLNVNGQIRRNTTNTLGSLWFNQSGGSITVRGKNQNTTRGMFEILNSGSQFNVSGGNLIIENDGSVSFADIFINPESSNVTGTGGGHTLTIGNASTPPASTFKLNSSAPLWNLKIDGTTNNKTASLQVNNLTILNDLTINGNGTAGTGSVFKANELDVTIGGSLTNNNLSSTSGSDQGGYQAGLAGSMQITTFTGTGNITGTGSNLTNFAMLVIGSASTTPVVTLGSNTNIRVNHDLTLTSGTLLDAGNTIYVLGDIANFGIHASPSAPGGGIVMSNSVKQKISGDGNGHFGNLTISNADGVNMVDDTWITGQLNLSGGSLYIDDYLLSLEADATFSGYDASHMVLSNGVMSDDGVRKNFAGSVSNFVFPVGSNGNYRPATFTLTSPTAGSIKIVPVAQAHPADQNPTNDQLNYYWRTSVSGFSGLTASTQVYQYSASDVSGNESLYEGALYNNNLWTVYGTSAIDAALHTINISRTDLLDGEYTAGHVANFVNKPVLYSVGTGNWSNGNNWSVNPSGTPLYGSMPNGNPVFIQASHYITMDVNSAYAFSVDIAGTLDLAATSLHNLGYITDTMHVGTGTIKIQSTSAGMFIFPGGNYERFMASPHTTVELYGSVSAIMPLKPGNPYKPYQNLILSGSGIKYMSAEHLKVLGNLTINSGTQLNNTLFNKNLYILGNWTDLNTTPATGGFVPGTGLASFEGSAAQTLTVSSAITENFYDFKINNVNGLTLAGAGNVQISDNLYLVNGPITTNTTNSLTLTNAGTSVVTGGSLNSFINGPLRKQINSGSYFTFPVGKTGSPSRYGNVYVSEVAGAGIWEAEYNNGMPAYDITRKKSPISHVSNNESWRIIGAAAGSANVQLRWDALSGYASSSAATRSKIRVVEWNPAGTQWEYRGKILNDISDISGKVSTDNTISLAPGTNLHYLTIGDEGLPTATITSSLIAAICNDGTATSTVTVALTGTPPWSLTYLLGSVSTTINNIASSPASVLLTSLSPGITGSGTFNFRITNVNDLTGTPGITDYVTAVALTVKPVPTNTITGKTAVGTGEVVTYSTPADASTYLWTLSGNGTVANPNTASCTVTWGSSTPGPYTITLTKTGVNGCAVTNSIQVTTSSKPTPVITGNQYACAGSTQTYSTPNVATHGYTWTLVPNTSGTISGTGSSITVTWNGAAAGNSVNVHEYVLANASNFTDASLPVDIGIQPSATPTYVAPATVCYGNAASVTVNNSESGVRYQIRNNSDNSVAGTAVVGTGGSIVLTTNAISSTATYNVYAYTLAPFSCGIQLTSPASTFTINCLTVLNYGTLSAGDQAICSGIVPNNIAFSTSPSGGTGTFTYQWYSYTGLAGTCPSGTSIPVGWTSIGSATSNSYTPPALSTSMSYAVMVTPTGSPSCGAATWASGCRQVTVTPAVTINAFSPATSTRCQGAGTTIYTTTGNNTTGITYSLDALSISGGNSIVAATGAVTFVAGWSGSSTITASAAGCGTPATTSLVVTTTPTVGLPVFALGATSSRCQGAATVTYAATATDNTSLTYTLDATNISSGNTIVAGTGAVSFTAGWIGTSIITISAVGCNGPKTATHTVTTSPLPSATIAYGSPDCLMPVTLTGTTGGSFSAVPAGLTINTATGEINSITSISGTYTVTYSIPSAGGCGLFTTTASVSVVGDRVWTGLISTDWNTTGNWSCNVLPDLTMNVLIPNVSNKPILSSGAMGAAKNIQINTGSSLTVLGMTLQIAGTITNNGTFTADNGTIEMKGVLAQTIPSGAFASNNLLNLIISNASGVTLSGALNITGYLKAATGDLASNGNLKLISSAAQTALIDGSGNGQVTGNVTMQRYLAIGYGYKYFSSPFTSLTVGAFAPYVNLAATFPTFYRYDENNSIGGLGIDFISGWVKWITSAYALNPMAGYAANFGNLVNPKTVEVTGVVSNGNISNPYLNHNRIYTTGFNLVGNPYPSPIDWNASGWTKTNIDNAIYFFDASIGSTDEWSGTYCSFVNGISSGGSTNIIPSMQGFFVHVTDGSFPVTGTLGMTNSVRKNDFTTPFKSATFDSRIILRFTAGFDVKGSISDQFVIYFDPMSTPLFDKEKDALKMMNTDPLVPNLYALTKDTRKVSISGIPVPNDSITRIPVGIKTLKDGWVNLNAVDISLLPSTLNVYLVDSDTKILQDLRKISSYRAYLSTGDNDKRFYLIFSTKDLTQSILPTGKLFTLSRIANQLLVNVNLPFNSDGELIMTNMQGQIMLRKSVFGLETVEINSNVSTGVYVITVISGKNRESEKIIIRKDYE